MELRFLLDEKAKKLLYASEVISHGHIPEAMLQYPNMFNGPFPALAKISAYARKRQMYFGKLIIEVEGNNADKELLELLEGLDAGKDDDALLGSVKDALVSDLSKYGSGLAANIKEVFGFALPNSVTVVLGQQNEGSGGSMLGADDGEITVGLFTSHETKTEEFFGVLAHEILHGLISLYKPLLRNKKASDLEELLLEYSVPHGILAWRIGLDKKFDTQFSYKNSLRRGYPEEMSMKVKEMVEKYASGNSHTTIWDEIKSAFPDCIDENRIGTLC